MKIKFNSDDDLPFNKKLKFHNMTITIKSIKHIKMLEYDRIDI